MSDSLDTALTDVKGEIARTDTKAALLIAFTGAGLAGGWSVVTTVHLPVLALVTGGGAAAALVMAAVTLLGVVRPNLGSGAGGQVGFPRWATLTRDEVLDDLALDDRADHIAVLARIAVAKHTRLQRAVDLTRAAIACGALTAILAIVGSI
ncbi:integral membrane plasmid transfer protein [Streptomyces kasugaensis]|uniref:Integral membrane plasmid transfer protein n=1 Tax=Streptomyces kasugaensis TaxID=1946 RepID=A0A4Q9HQ36_STRKA|nr:Pycsar system effector family protein [Streptomyces kasugaensis]TBO57027.1 integral membrane plasmid transfer protein [Streptomyces kasugaensis]